MARLTWNDVSYDPNAGMSYPKQDTNIPGMDSPQPTKSNNNIANDLMAESNKRLALDMDNAKKQNELAQMQNQSAFSGTYTGSNGGYLSKLSNVESGGDYYALNKGSGAFGKYQFMPATEKQYAKKLGFSLDQARTPEGQEAMISAFTNDNVSGLKKAGVPVTDETMWWAHNQGLGGAINLYKGNALNSKNLKSNGGNSNQEYINRWRGIFG